MRSWASTATLLLSSTIIGTSTLVFSNPISSLYRYVDDIKQCPRVKVKEDARTIYDVWVIFWPKCASGQALTNRIDPCPRRPDDFSVVMALGDSITAGLFATPSEIPDTIENPTDSRLQRPFSYIRNRVQRYMGSVGTGASAEFIPGFEEYRGVSYATGVDVGVESLPNVRPAFDNR